MKGDGRREEKNGWGAFSHLTIYTDSKCMFHIVHFGVHINRHDFALNTFRGYSNFICALIGFSKLYFLFLFVLFSIFFVNEVRLSL